MGAASEQSGPPADASNRAAREHAAAGASAARTLEPLTASAARICPSCGLAWGGAMDGAGCPQCGFATLPAAEEADDASAVTPVSFGLPLQPRSARRGNPFRRPRNIPRQDLLTPRDLARAFALTYDPLRSAPPPPAPQSVPLAARLDAIGRWNAAVNAHFARAAGIASICLMALMMAAAVITFAVAGDRAAHAAFAWLSAGPVGGTHRPVATNPAPTALDRVKPAPHLQVSIAPPPPKPPAPAADADPADAASDVHDDVRSLWAAALEAESRKQFGQAVKLYDRIESLPNDCWPASLPTRVALAREELVAGTW
jgi:hypothetical protein